MQLLFYLGCNYKKLARNKKKKKKKSRHDSCSIHADDDDDDDNNNIQAFIHSSVHEKYTGYNGSNIVRLLGIRMKKKERKRIFFLSSFHS